MTNRSSNQRKILFRLAAVLLGLLPFFITEVVLRTVGWNEPNQTTEISDPYVGFSELNPLFVASAEGDMLEVAANRQPLFQPDSFMATKPTEEYRIFCLGGSTVQGRPYSIETSFTTWLELALNSGGSKQHVDVVNCGGVSYASYRLVPILEEVIGYSPDLIVLYTGHNEFLEDRTYQNVKATADLIANTHRLMSKLETYRLVRSYFKGGRQVGARSSQDKALSELPAEVEARLDYRNGLNQYQRDDPWQANVIEHYEFNLRRMIRIAKQADIPIVLINPVSNLRNIEPFKSQHSAGLSQAVLMNCEQQWLNFAENESTGIAVSDAMQIEILEDLLANDQRYALTHFRLAQAYHASGKFDLAKKHFLLAKENDICPLRMLEPMHDIIRNVANEMQTPLVDARKFFEDRTDDKIPGRESLVDHVHPTIFGHQLLAKLLVEHLDSLELISVADDWEAHSDEAFQTHLKALPFMYFQRGRDRLNGLKRWAEGRVTRERGGS